MISSGNLSQGSLAQVQEVVYFSSGKHMQLHTYFFWGRSVGTTAISCVKNLSLLAIWMVFLAFVTSIVNSFTVTVNVKTEL